MLLSVATDSELEQVGQQAVDAAAAAAHATAAQTARGNEQLCALLGTKPPKHYTLAFEQK